MSTYAGDWVSMNPEPGYQFVDGNLIGFGLWLTAIGKPLGYDLVVLHLGVTGSRVAKIDDAAVEDDISLPCGLVNA